MAEKFNERSRCLHCVDVVMDIFPKILQKVMERSPISPKTLFEIIHKDFKFKKKLKQPDYHTIQTLLTDGFTKLDLTIIFKIISHFSNMFINPPTRGWSSDPQPNETTIGDDAQRLKLIRNHFFHKAQTSATEAEYEDFFEKVKEICQRVDTHLNLQSDETFTTLLQSYHAPPWERLTAIEQQYTEQKGLTELLVVKIDNRNFTVYQTRSMKELLQEQLKTRSDNQEKMEPITLTFPEVTAPEVVRQIEEELKEEINNGLVNIQLRRATEGSLVLEISVRQMVLLDDEKLRKELEVFLTRLLSRKELQCFILSQNIVMDEDYGFYEETDSGDITEDKYNTGGLKLHLEVTSAILQSDVILQGEIQNLLETMVSKSNGSQIFKSNPVTAILEPDIKEKDMSQITKRPFPTQLNIQEKISIDRTQYLYYARGCCILQSGIVVAWGFNRLSKCDAVVLYNSDKSIRSMVEFEHPGIKDVAPISDNLIAVLCSPYHIFNYAAILCDKIYIMNVLTGTVVSSIDTEYMATAIAHRNNELILCANRQGIMRMKLEIYKDILFDVSTSDDTGDSIKKNKDDLIYAYKGIRTVKLDEEKHKDLLSERSHIFSSQDIIGDSVREKEDFNKDSKQINIKGKEKDKKNNFKEAEDEEDFGTKQTFKSYDKHANMVKVVYVNYQGDAEVSYHDKSEIMEISNQSERKTIQAGHRSEKIGRKVEETYEIKEELINAEMMSNDEDIGWTSKIAVGSERICFTCPGAKKIKILNNNYKVIKVINTQDLDLTMCDTSMTMDEQCNIYIVNSYTHNVVVISPDGETWHDLQRKDREKDGFWETKGIDYNHHTKQLVVADRDAIHKYSVDYD